MTRFSIAMCHTHTRSLIHILTDTFCHFILSSVIYLVLTTFYSKFLAILQITSDVAQPKNLRHFHQKSCGLIIYNIIIFRLIFLGQELPAPHRGHQMRVKRGIDWLLCGSIFSKSIIFYDRSVVYKIMYLQ